jgi:hypothetical protein
MQYFINLDTMDLKSEVYMNKNKKKPLIITNPSYSPSLYKSHPLFTSDKLHSKYLYGSSEKLNSLMHFHSPSITPLPSPSPSYPSLISTLQSSFKSSFTVIDTGLESLLPLYLSTAYSSNPIDTLFLSLYRPISYSPSPPPYLKPIGVVLPQVFRQFYVYFDYLIL